DARSGASGTPSAANISTQAPSAPNRAQDPPPSASTVTPAAMAFRPSGVSNTTTPAASQPVQRQRVCSRTPCPASRLSQARRSGEAFIPFGNTSPELPVKQATPSLSPQSRTASGPNSAIIGASQSAP